MSVLLRTEEVAVTYASGGRTVAALRRCSLQIARGEVLALVGESGSGKSTFARVVAGIVPPSSGRLEFEGRDLAALPAGERRTVRRRIQMVFQDPDASLNPWHAIGTLLAEPFEVAGVADRAEIRRRVVRLMDMVRLDPGMLDRRPRQLSGGQKQRVAIARALALEPALLIADEALSALDVSTQAAIAELLRDLQRRLGIAILFISHDLATVRSLATRVAVMHGGEIVEQGDCAAVLDAPAHPYTRLLVAAMPELDRRRVDFALVDALDRVELRPVPPGGCGYYARCMRREPACEREPALLATDSATVHLARCHFRNEPAPRARAQE